MMNKINSRLLSTLIFLMCIGSIVFALIMQVYFDMQPCPLCVLQRITILIIALVSLISLIINIRLLNKVFYIIILILSLIGIGLACKQLWVEAHPQVTSYICQVQMGSPFDGWPFSQMLELLFTAQTTCEKAIYTLLGVRFPIWSALFFIVLAIFSVFGFRLKKISQSK